MYEGHSVSVVIPAYNEAEFVARTIETVPSFVDRIYPVDDGSTDGTWSEITSMAESINTAEGPPRVVPTRHGSNRGVGAAIKTGYAAACADGSDVVAVMAGDGQMDPDHLATIVDPVVNGVVGYAKGNRLHRPADFEAMSRWRRFGNGLLTMLTRIASGYWEMTDPQNGYTAIGCETLESIPYERLYDRYGFANDLLIVLNTYEVPIADVNHPAVYGEETSDIRYRTFVPVLSWLLLNRFIWRLWKRYLVRGFHPVVPTYALGVGGIAVGMGGLVLGVAGATDRMLTDGLISGVIVLVGTLLVATAMWFDARSNRDLVLEVAGPDQADKPSHRHDRQRTDATVSDGGRDARSSGADRQVPATPRRERDPNR